MGHTGYTWDILVTHGTYWLHMGHTGYTWDILVTHGTYWLHMGHTGYTWDILVTYGTYWLHIWDMLVTPKCQIMCLLIFCTFSSSFAIRVSFCCWAVMSCFMDEIMSLTPGLGSSVVYVSLLDRRLFGSTWVIQTYLYLRHLLRAITQKTRQLGRPRSPVNRLRS